MVETGELVLHLNHPVYLKFRRNTSSFSLSNFVSNSE